MLVANPRISRRRWVILALLFLITVINFIDRQTLSVLAPVIRASFHLSNTQYGRIVAAFQFGMMSGEIPMGAMMDRIGARIGLALAVFWWSSATGAQFLARTGVQFGLTRFWMGTGECGNYSGGMKTVTRLFSKAERTLAIGIFNGGSMVGATIAPPLIVLLLHGYGFRAAFLVPALCGMVWLPLWWWAHGREPQASRVESPGLKPLDSVGPLPRPKGRCSSEKAAPRVFQHSVVPAAAAGNSLRSMLGESSSWAVMMCRFFIGPVIQFYWYWIPAISTACATCRCWRSAD